MTLQENFNFVRAVSENLCGPLITEDYSVQPSVFASPPKWHLAHVTWFWEQFVLTAYLPGYEVFDDDFSFLFNSYYNNVGKRVLRPVRVLMTRPGVDEVYRYCAYVNDNMNRLFEKELSGITSNQIKAPLYWHEIEGAWQYYDLGGLQELAADEPVRHISFYEAFAFAQWKGMRLPTEQEWEVASSRFNWGQLWEWTTSAYLAYPGYVKQPGALGNTTGSL